MFKLTLAVLALTLFVGGASIARSVNAIKSTRVSTTTILASCEDEREPIVSHISETTTAIIITCKVTQ
jgi:hypothetical protein